MRSVAKAAQIGYQIGQDGYRYSGDKIMREPRTEFACRSLDSHGLIQSGATIKAFLDNYRAGWKKAAASAANKIAAKAEKEQA